MCLYFSLHSFQANYLYIILFEFVSRFDINGSVTITSAGQSIIPEVIVMNDNTAVLTVVE